MALSTLAWFLLCPTLVNTLFITNVNSNGEIDMVGMVLNMTAEMKTIKENDARQIANEARLLAKLNTMEAHEAGLSARLKALEEKNNQHVIFTARISQHDVDIPPAGYAIKFDTVISNTGGGYNPHTGVFHTPVAGTYMFSLQIMVNQGDEYDIVLRAEGVVKLTLMALDKDYVPQASGTVILHLDKGDEVVVEPVYTSCTSNCKLRGGPFSQFAGVLLNAD